MNAEEQIIGSLLLDGKRIDDMGLLSPEMFNDTILGKIFSLYKNAEGKEVNLVTIVPEIVTAYLNESQANQMLATIVSDHDPGVSDESCTEIIYNKYRVKKFNELLNHTVVNAQNIDSIFGDFKNTMESLHKAENKSEGMTLAEMVKYKDNYFKEKKNRQFNTGFNKIDKAIGGLDNGDVIVIAARPGVGKSALALQLIRKFGRDDFKPGYFNLEMASNQLYERTIAALSGIDMIRIRLATNFLNDEKQMFDEGNKKLEQEKNVRVFTGTQTLESIRAIQKKYKFDIIVIDYMQLIKTTGNRQNRVAEVGDISRGLKAIATDFNIPVIALSQLNRASEMNKDKEPSMSELRESGDIEQDASVILMLWNPNRDDVSEKKLKVEKSRNGYLERETLYFDGKHMTFTTMDLDKEYEIPFEIDDESPFKV